MCGRGEYSLKPDRHKEQNGKTADFKWSVFSPLPREFNRPPSLRAAQLETKEMFPQGAVCYDARSVSESGEPSAYEPNLSAEELTGTQEPGNMRRHPVRCFPVPEGGEVSDVMETERILPDNKERRLKIGFFIIAYNAEAHIERTLARIPPDVWEEVSQVYIVDDCSTDETVARALAMTSQYPKLNVIRNRVNRRYGGNQKTGYQFAIDRDLDVVVLLHADGQYAPEVIRSLYAPILENQADVVLGSRMLHRQEAIKGGMPRYKYLGNIVLTHIQNALTGLRLSEFHTGYRAYRVSYLRAIPFWENSDEWHFDTEILLQAYAAHVRVVEVPIPTYYGEEICHVNGLLYAANCIFTSLAFSLYRRGLFYVRKFDVNLAGRKYFSKLSDRYSSHAIISRELDQRGLAGKKILELGVGDATLTEKMSQAGGLVTCVEWDALFAELARPFAQEVIIANAEEQNFQMEKGNEYDLIVAADILEHLVKPEIVLSKLKAALRKGGLLVVSLPNVANLYVRLNLLLGRFPYHSKGLLDQTHLRFYTLKSMRKLMEKTGWIVETSTVTSIPLAIVFPFLQKRSFRWMLSLLHGLTRAFPGPLAYQGILLCRNPNESALL